jgi:tRNA isopentenyl-2-thiomethyl-A-37 hydroxylase MiaE
MKNQTVITYKQAKQKSKELNQQQQQVAEEKLEEFLTSSLRMLDARDIRYYASITGKTANDLRRMHPQNDTQVLLDTFDFYNDDIINFF